MMKPKAMGDEAGHERSSFRQAFAIPAAGSLGSLA